MGQAVRPIPCILCTKMIAQRRKKNDHYLLAQSCHVNRVKHGLYIEIAQRQEYSLRAEGVLTQHLTIDP